MANPLITKLEKRDRLSDEEKRALENAVTHVREFKADQDMVREGERQVESKLLLDGFACRYKLLAEGRRQISAIHVTGDFVDLHSFLLHVLDHSVAALTDCKAAQLPHEALREITERYPHLSRLLWLSTLIDASIHREWIVSLGRRSALKHVAHLICELFVRLGVTGATEAQSFRLPLTQGEVGDVLGLSTVHVNRVIQELRAQGLITWRSELVTINDWDRLSEVAEFDPGYLYLEREPR